MTSTSSGLTMLTSGASQYLHPDYLQPLPTTLDAKKSPLALLAQTCSAIGKDTSPSKPIIPPLEKSDKPSDSDSCSLPKRPNSHGHKDSSSKDNKPGFRTFPPKEIPPLVPIQAQSPDKLSGSTSSSSSSLPSSESKSRSPVSDPALGGPTTNPPSSSSSSSSSSRPVSRVGSSSNNSGVRSSSRGSNSGKADSDHHHHSHHHHSHHQHHSSNHQSHHRSRDSPSSSSSSTSASFTSASSPSSHPKLSSSSSSCHPTPVMQSLSSLSSTMKPSMNSNPSLLSGLNPAHLAGYPHPLSLMGHGLDPTNAGYHSALAAHSSLSSLSAAAAAAQSSALKAAAAAAGGAPPSALSPYVTYARVRTPSGATTLVPVCRDPYCTNCQLTLQNSHLSATCTAPGCPQCAHEKSLTSLSALGHLGAASSLLLPPLSSSSASSLSSNLSALSSLHSLYPPSALAAAAHQGLPFTCNWVAGNDYCGKRFNSSEELLQHLRTHTSGMDSSSLAASYAGLGLPSALAAYPHFAASAPLSPNSLRRAYPTSLSPVSNLLGASRYHPYKSPLSGVPQSPQAPQNFAPVGPFFSPYTLFGQRLGAAAVP